MNSLIKVAASLFTLLILPLIFIVSMEIPSQIGFYHSAARTEGTVQEVISDVQPKGKFNSEPAERYQILFEAEGNTFETETRTKEDIGTRAVGDNLTVLYNPSDPTEYKVDRGIWKAYALSAGAFIVALGLWWNFVRPIPTKGSKEDLEESEAKDNEEKPTENNEL